MSVISSVGRQWFKYRNFFLLCLREKQKPVYNLSHLRTFFKGNIIFSTNGMGDKPAKPNQPKFEVSKEELKKRLTPVQYHVTQEKGTERAFTGKYNKCKDIGIYSCVVCSQDLFSSATKFESGCGWPSFNDVIEQGKVKLSKDTSHVGANLLLLIANPGMVRTEVTCSFCGAHLGHVFNDGPKPTRRRFCINSAALNFRPAPEEETPEQSSNGS